MNYRSIAVFLLAAVSSFGSGITLITPSDPGYAIYQQTNQNPCVIGDNPCGPNEPIPYLTISGAGNINSYDVTSPEYTVAQLQGVLNSSYFTLGLDLNNNNNAQGVQLVAMEVKIGGVFVETQAWSDNVLLSAANNGSGFSDVLFSYYSLAGLSSTDLVRFHLKMDPVNPGAESLFLIATNSDGVITTNAVPEPSTAVLLSGALLGLGLWRRRTTGKA